MGGEWIEDILGNVLTLQRGFDLPKSKRIPGVYPVIASTGQVGTHNEAKVRGPGVVIGRSGSLGGAQYITKNFWPLNTTLWVKDFKGNDPRFCYYLLRSLNLERFNAGSGVPTLNRNHIHPLPVSVPRCTREQRAIARILGALDDKIELNRRMNETLEAMAQALFKSWFVDFDPVVVNALRAGNPIPEKFAKHAAHYRDNPDALGLPEDILRLFPTRFVDSELGPIPEGWEVGPLGTFFTLGLGGVWGQDHRTERATLAVRCLRGIDCHNLAEGQIPEAPIRWVSRRQAANRQLTDGTILIEGSGSFCGRSLIWLSYYNDLFQEPVLYSNFCKRIDPQCSMPQAIICWMQLRQAYQDGILQTFRTGTAFPNLDIQGILQNLLLIVPPIPVAQGFEQVFALTRRVELMIQSRHLAALRDTLLPKLISGELRVPDVERILEGAG